MSNQASSFVRGEIRKLENRFFVIRILSVFIGYGVITLWLNSIRIAALVWFVWVLITIQFLLYFSIFIFSYQRSKECGFDKNIAAILFVVLAILGRVNDWELLLLPLLVIVMFVVSAKNKQASKKDNLYY